MNWFIAALKKYATFSGRAQRSEYWYFVLFYILIILALAVIDPLSGSLHGNSGYGLLSSLFTFAMIIPSIAVGVRRLHDTDRSGWWMLMAAVPLIGSIVLFVFFVQDSQAGDNRFGANPKAVG